VSLPETFYAGTADGWRLALTRFAGGASKRPVVLCHGLGSNRHSFDFSPESSLARHLAGRGRDAWCLELRGYGLSESKTGSRWTFDDFIEKDLPAALVFVMEQSDGAAPHFIGHSMGGIALLAYLAMGGRGVQAGVAIGSSLDYSGSASGFKAVTPLKPLAKVMRRLPLRALTRLWSPLAGRFRNPVDEFQLWLPNTDGPRYREFTKIGVDDPSADVAAQLASLFEPGGLRSADGKKRYFEGLKDVRTPMLLLAGDKDRQCPPDAAAVTLAGLGGDKELATFGKAHGHAEHYGHMDLVIGRRAALEVYPVLDRWFDARD